MSTWIRITNRIVRYIVQHFIKHMTHSLNCNRMTVISQGNILLLGLILEIVYYIFCKLIQFHTFHGNHFILLFIQPGQLDNICHQITKTIGFFVNSP